MGLMDSSKKHLPFGRKRSAEEPAYAALAEYSNFGPYLFDDGTFGEICEPDFDIDDYLEDGEDYKDLKLGRKKPAGNIYIDRWTRDGDFIQGGCFLYYDGETLADYCRRNGEPLPMRRIPYEVIEALEAGDLDELERYYDEVPELKR